jgi:D-alanyl-lipoteichoic acid acyltransferase DltB (MBOAT superfamily)
VLFNTLSYLIFLLSCVIGYWLLPSGGRKWLVLTASLLFYAAWRVEFVLLISFSAFVDYYFSLRIHDSRSLILRRVWLILSLSINIGLLLYFKYAYFLADNFAGVGRLIGKDWAVSVGHIVLPLGISFYTFLSISYTVDVFRRVFDPIRSFPVYLSYVMFWPHMIAGPILRAHELIPQIVDEHRFHIDHITTGVRTILFGLFLKVVLADQIAPMVDGAFATDPKILGGVDVLTMAYAFGFQIYFDFAGYSMIAIGSARLLGVRFPENFNWPYLATSPREFWKRWHITLSSWIRDYLYLPLTGGQYLDRSVGGIEIQAAQRNGNALRASFALFLTWFIMGLWHGASWSFALWGFWHAIFILAYRLLNGRLGVLPKPLLAVTGWGLTISIAMLGWLPFRARTLEHTFALLGRLTDWRSYGELNFRENFYLVTFALLVGMLLFRSAVLLRPRVAKFRYCEWIADVTVTAFVMFAVFIFLRPISQFIYFQF